MKFILIFILCSSLILALELTEVMYNPSQDQGNDKDLEWIEFYSEDEINLGDYYFYNNKLENKTVKDYFIITRNKNEFSDYYKENITLIEAKFILSNEGGYINLSSGKDYILNYNNDLANGNGKSLVLYGGNFYESLDFGGSPGMENPINKLKEYKILINEFMPNPEGKDNGGRGEWVELYNPNNKDLDLYGYYVSDLKDKKVYITSVSGGTEIKANGFLVIYFKGVTLLNNDGDEIKLKVKNVIIDKVSYDHSKEGLSWSKMDDEWIKTFPSDGEENSKKEVKEDSLLKIENIYLGNDNKAQFGDTIGVRIHYYKGDTEKKSISLYIENLSYRTKFNVDHKFINYSFTLPLKIDSNCNNKTKDGYYTVILEGLGKRDGKTVRIEGNNKDFCEKVEIKKYINNTETILNKGCGEKIIYEDKGIKAKRYALLFFCSILVLVIIVQFKNER